jgi:tetratricopeptide (TPR) repeat protein
MAYNKSKYVEAAQKLLNQGKVPQAIAEYQQILKHEPKDQVTLMTVGELFIRQNEPRQAIEYFERLAQIFVGDGFLTKAIAVYKRIAKLVPDEIKPLEKLAELYVQQGVMSEARPLFLQLAEIHLKGNRQAEAVNLLKKLLSAEPDNLRIQVRLADLYQAMGQTQEAVTAYVEAAQRAMARGEQSESDRLAEKVLKLDPQNAGAITVKVRGYAAQGKLAEAAQLLEQLPDLEQGGEQAELLLDLYRKSSKWDELTKLALRVFEADNKNFRLAQKAAEILLEASQNERAMGLVGQIRLPLIDAGEHEAIAQLLGTLIARLPDNLEPHEWLVDTLGRTSNSFQLPDALANFGDALVAAGEYERAKEVLQQLVDHQPESEAAKSKLDEALRLLGGGGPAATPAAAAPAAAAGEDFPMELPRAPSFLEEAFQVELAKEPAKPAFTREEAAEPVAAKPLAPAEAPLDEETQQFIAQSLTDVDLFASYGLTQKAIGLLDAVLRRAPRHTPTLEKLLDFVLGAGDDKRTAELAAQLEQIHREHGDERNAERFGELRRRFQRAAGLPDLAAEGPPVAAALVPPPAAAAAPPAPVPPVQAPTSVAAQPPAPAVQAPAPPPAPAVEIPVELSAEPAAAVHEVDLSDEWAEMLSQNAVAEAAAPPPAAPVTPAEADVAEFHLPPAEEAAPLPEPAAEIPELMEPAAPSAPKAAKPAQKKEPAVSEPAFEVEEEYDLVLEPEALVPAHEQLPPLPPAAAPPKKEAPAAATFSSEQFLEELASELDNLGLEALAPPAEKTAAEVPAAKAPAKPASPPAAETGDNTLQDVFNEFRAEIGEMNTEDEDLETHYNLGIAFREMGLLEEAISEFQKVAKANDHGRAFRYAMQCCTLLGLAFMEKGQPRIAAHWYERALQTPDLDPESILALRYDLGVAQESAGDLEAALKSFSKVYASNIDYRDVGERIATLEKTAR